jgi:hypothetical protein
VKLVVEILLVIIVVIYQAMGDNIHGEILVDVACPI